MRIAIIGSGIFGSYVSNRIGRSHDVVVFECGGALGKYPSELDRSTTNIGDFNYGGFNKGRQFGKGGTSSVWGGQSFFLDEFDAIFSNNCFYKELCLIKKRSSAHFTSNIRIKNGKWYYPWNKRKRPRRTVDLRLGVQIIKIKKLVDGKVSLIDYTNNAYTFDFVFLCAGVFENLRLLGIKNYIVNDHLSIRLGNIRSSAFDKSLIWKLHFSALETKRLYFCDLSFGHYVHFIVNKNTEIVEMTRRLIKGERLGGLSWYKVFLEIFRYAPLMLITRRFGPIEGSDVEVILDLESRIGTYNQDNDEFNGLLDLNEIHSRYAEIKKRLELVRGLNIEFEANPKAINYEDIYHPFNIHPPKSLNHYFAKAENIFRIDTGLLASCGATNPTTTLYPLIDEIVKRAGL